MFRPLKGIKVVDLTSVLAGPYCSYQLALLGAEVIKIENVNAGDWTRSGGKDPELNKKYMGTSFLIQNSEKRSIQINLKELKGQKIAQKLIKNADVFIENMRPGTAEKLGLGWKKLSKISKNLIYCSISAFGQDGPLSKRGAYDHVIQGMSGIMSTTGTKESGPTKVGSPYIDYATGLNAAFSITAALNQAKIDAKPIKLDVSMFDTSFLLMANMVTDYLNTGWEPQPMGNEAASGSPSSGMYYTLTSPILLAANTNEQFFNLCEALNSIRKFNKEKWLIEKDRKENQAELRKELQDIISKRSAEDLEVLLNEFKVPAGRLRTLPEAISEDQFLKRKLWNKIRIDSISRDFYVPSLGFKVNNAVVVPKKPPPERGKDTRKVLREIGLDEVEIALLKKEKIVS